MKPIYYILLTFSSHIWGSPLSDLLREVRDPSFKSHERVQILSDSHKKMTKKLAHELGESEDKLPLVFIQNSTSMNHLYSDDWYDLQTEFYTTLHQENFRRRWVELQKLVKFTSYGKNIYQSMYEHWGEYSPLEEDTYYIRWNHVEANSGARVRKYKVPYFLMNKDIQQLINTEAHVPFEEIFPKNKAASNLEHFLANTSQLNRIKRQELAEKMELNKRILNRAIANGVKTIASIYYLSGLKNLDETQDEIELFLKKNCQDCSPKEIQSYIKAASYYVKLMSGPGQSLSLTQLKNQLCTTLKENKYSWSANKLMPTPTDILSDPSKIAYYIIANRLQEINQKAMAKMLLYSDLGILILTKSLSVLDHAQTPIGTYLNCLPKTTSSDILLLKSAIKEAHHNVELYLKRVEKKVKESQFNLEKTDQTLEYFVQTNQSATIEAIANYPQGIGWILKSLAELDQDSRRRKKVDVIVAWGGTITGIALTLSGVASPEGFTVLISTASFIKGVTAGTYSYVRAKQEKEFYNELLIAKKGNLKISEENLQEHFGIYKSLKVAYIKELGVSSVHFISLHHLAVAKSGGDIKRAHSALKYTLEGIKEVGKNESIGKIQEKILDNIISN